MRPLRAFHTADSVAGGRVDGNLFRMRCALPQFGSPVWVDLLVEPRLVAELVDRLAGADQHEPRAAREGEPVDRPEGVGQAHETEDRAVGIQVPKVLEQGCGFRRAGQSIVPRPRPNDKAHGTVAAERGAPARDPGRRTGPVRRTRVRRHAPGRRSRPGRRRRFSVGTSDQRRPRELICIYGRCSCHQARARASVHSPAHAQPARASSRLTALGKRSAGALARQRRSTASRSAGAFASGGTGSWT